MKRARPLGVRVMFVALTATGACASNATRVATPACAARPCAPASNMSNTAQIPSISSANRSRTGEQELAISNPSVAQHPFLAGMSADDYFPEPLVDKAKAILLRLCERIERERPADTAALYVLTHAATEEFNLLDEEFAANGSEIETAAREAIAADFAWIAKAYGYDADLEELIATREW